MLKIKRHCLQRTFFNCRKSLNQKRFSEFNVKNQDSIIKQRAIEFLEHTNIHSHMTNIEVTHIETLYEKISMLQK